MLQLALHVVLVATLCSAAQPHFSTGDDFPTLASYLSVPAPAPIIGILAQPTPQAREGNGSQRYLAASYVKYVESGGARAVPVFTDRPEKELRKLFTQLNGLLVPGGGQKLAPGEEFYDATSLFTDLAMEAYDIHGEVFPIQYTCLGFEAAAVKFSNNPYIVSNLTGTYGVVSELTWTPDAKDARSLRLVPPDVMEQAARGGLVYQSHHHGVWLPDFLGSELAEFFDLLSTTRDALGKAYVSTMQARRYPFMATAWHPEKNLFEFRRPAIPHSLPAKQLAQALANQYITWAQMSTHAFESDEELKKLIIYNYAPVVDPGDYFDQVYIWNSTTIEA